MTEEKSNPGSKAKLLFQNFKIMVPTAYLAVPIAVPSGYEQT